MRFVYGWDIGWHRIGTIGHGEIWANCELSPNDAHRIMAGRRKEAGPRKLSRFGNCNEPAMWYYELWHDEKSDIRVVKLTRRQR